MDISIIIVNWNSLEFTKTCIASIYTTVHNITYEIIVIDNASSDAPCRELMVAYPAVKLILTDHNLGFARANNLGVEHSCGKHILFLNPDTIVQGDAIQKMVAQLELGTNIGAVGCRLLNPDLSLQMSCIQAFPTIANQLLGVDVFKTHFPNLSLWGMRPLFSASPELVSDVEVVSGACLMVNRIALEQVQFFSTEYFMYAEEADLCYKIHRAGWRICHISDAKIIHFGGQSTKMRGEGFVDILMRESIYIFLQKFRGHLHARCYHLLILFSASLRLIIMFPFTFLSTHISAFEVIPGSFRKWRKIALWCLTPAKRSKALWGART